MRDGNTAQHRGLSLVSSRNAQATTSLWRREIRGQQQMRPRHLCSGVLVLHGRGASLMRRRRATEQALLGALSRPPSPVAPRLAEGASPPPPPPARLPTHPAPSAAQRPWPRTPSVCAAPSPHPMAHLSPRTTGSPPAETPRVRAQNTVAADRVDMRAVAGSLPRASRPGRAPLCPPGCLERRRQAAPPVGHVGAARAPLGPSGVGRPPQRRPRRRADSALGRGGGV